MSSPSKSGTVSVAPCSRAGTVGVFDAGVGGFPIANFIKLRAPRSKIVYLGDTARRPYGPQPKNRIIEYVAQAERFMADQDVDVWVIACNTASVIVGDALSDLLPVVDMVTAAASCVVEIPSGSIGLLGTAGTVASGAYSRALPDREIRAVAVEELLRLAEIGGGDDPDRLRSLARDSAKRLSELGADAVILGCTDFTSILSTMRDAFGTTQLVDPAERAARLAVEMLSDFGREPVDEQDRLYLTAPAPIDPGKYALSRFGLVLPEPEYVTLR